MEEIKIKLPIQENKKRGGDKLVITVSENFSGDFSSWQCRYLLVNTHLAVCERNVPVTCMHASVNRELDDRPFACKLLGPCTCKLLEWCIE